MAERRGLKALELWCRRVTEGYRDVRVCDMSASWRDGLAFCALIHHFRPDLIDFDGLRKEEVLANNRLAFSVAEAQLGIPALLDAEDMLAHRDPDRLSVATYVSQFYQYFEGGLGSRRRAASALKRPAGAPSATSPALSVGPPTKVLGVADTCHVCRNRVFLLERLMVDGRLYHRCCFRCSRCSAILSPGAYNECDTSPGSYECTVCPKDEGPEFALDENARPEPSPKPSPKPTPSPVSKPEVPEKKTELSESVRMARKHFQSTMVTSATPSANGTPETTPVTARKTVEETVPSKSESDVLMREHGSSTNDVAKWTAIQKPELPAFLRRHEDVRSSTVQENIKRFSRLSADTKGCLTTSRSSSDLGTPERVVKDGRLSSIHSSSEQGLASAPKIPGVPSMPLSPPPPTSPENGAPKTTGLSKRGLDLPVIKSDVPPTDLLPRPAPRYKTLKLGTSGRLAGDESSLEDSKRESATMSVEETCLDVPPPLPLGPPPDLGGAEENPNGLPTSLSTGAPMQAETPNRKTGDPTRLSSREEAPAEPSPKPTSRTISGISSSTPKTPAATVSPQGTLTRYPKTLNPFGDSDEDEDYPESLNPFEEEEEEESTPADSVYDSSLNPFSEDDDDEAPRAPPRLTPVSQRSTNPSPLRPSPRARKKPAPPPPPTLAAPPKEEPSKVGQKEEPSKVPPKEEQSKAPRDTFGYWKRKKRPAPSVPIPVRREIKRIPLKEIQAEMQEIAQKQEELERQGREIEVNIRDRNGKYPDAGEGAADSEPSLEEEEMIMQLFELVNEKNALFRRQAELMYIKRSQRLEEEQVELEYQIRCIMTKPLNQKCEEDASREEELLQRLLEVVEQRNEIVDSQEMDRRRVMQEDWSIQEQMAQRQSEMKEKMASPEAPKKPKKAKKAKKSKESKMEDEDKRKSLRRIFKDKLVLSK
uniref:Putative beta-spectrin n=1 Tax=Ixodes ricinus TaxID=34613 RepID=A0A147BRP3_IXORI